MVINKSLSCAYLSTRCRPILAKSLVNRSGIRSYRCASSLPGVTAASPGLSQYRMNTSPLAATPIRPRPQLPSAGIADRHDLPGVGHRPVQLDVRHRLDSPGLDFPVEEVRPAGPRRNGSRCDGRSAAPAAPRARTSAGRFWAWANPRPAAATRPPPAAPDGLVAEQRRPAQVQPRRSRRG